MCSHPLETTPDGSIRVQEDAENLGRVTLQMQKQTKAGQAFAGFTETVTRCKAPWAGNNRSKLIQNLVPQVNCILRSCWEEVRHHRQVTIKKNTDCSYLKMLVNINGWKLPYPYFIENQRSVPIPCTLWPQVSTYSETTALYNTALKAFPLLFHLAAAFLTA